MGIGPGQADDHAPGPVGRVCSAQEVCSSSICYYYCRDAVKQAVQPPEIGPCEDAEGRGATGEGPQRRLGLRAVPLVTREGVEPQEDERGNGVRCGRGRVLDRLGALAEQPGAIASGDVEPAPFRIL